MTNRPQTRADKSTGKKDASPAKSSAGTENKSQPDTLDIPPTEAGLVRLHAELVGLFEHLNRLRDELAAIKNPVIEDMHFARTGSQLMEIVTSTEQATNTIMEAVEKNEEMITTLRESIEAKDQSDILDRISENDMAILEACSFQDLTGQRVNKVITFVSHIERQIDALCDIWGADGLMETPPKANDTRTDDKKLLRGPSLTKDDGVSQDDIDALFD